MSQEQPENQTAELIITQGPAPSDTPSLTQAQKRFYASEQCIAAREALQALVDNGQYNTDSDYYSENVRGFVDRHLHFLSTHPNASLAGYISNLKLMIRSRGESGRR